MANVTLANQTLIMSFDNTTTSMMMSTIATNTTNETTLAPEQEQPGLFAPQIMSQQMYDDFNLWINGIFLPLFTVIGVFGNIINMVVLRKHGFQTTSNIAFFTLAIADFFTCVFNFIYNCDTFVGFFSKKYAFLMSIIKLRIFLPLATACMKTEGMIVVVIAIERFLAVYFPLKVGRWLTPKRMFIACGICPFLAFGVLAPNFVSWDLDWIWDPTYNWTVPDPLIDGNIWPLMDQPGFYIYAFLVVPHLTGTLNEIIVVASCVAISIKLSKQRRWRKKQSVQKAASKEDRITLTMLVIMVIFSGSVFIYVILLSYCSYDPPFCLEFGPYFYISITISNMNILQNSFNCMINVFIYVLLNPKFRQTFMEVFCCQKPPQK